MGIYATKEFARFARKAELAEGRLVSAAQDVLAGRHDADLGGGVYKQRVGRDGGGKSGGFRTIVLFKAGSHVFFVHGFAKKDKANVTGRELKALKLLADTMLGFTEDQVRAALASRELTEVVGGGEDSEAG